VPGETPAQPEYIVCDTSVISLLLAAKSAPERIAHWTPEQRGRLDDATVATTVFTLGEMRAGFRRASWGAERIDEAETVLAGYLLLPVDFDVLASYVDLRTSYFRQIGDNDMWIAATAKARQCVLATCDLDFCILKSELDLMYLPRQADSPATCP
jgi:predicted nucleic acid-binding protein